MRVSRICQTTIEREREREREREMATLELVEGKSRRHGNNTRRGIPQNRQTTCNDGLFFGPRAATE